jgi:hypothetical protein
MWTAAVDQAKQLLQLRFSGSVGLEEAQACLKEVRQLVAGIRPGFMLLTDLSELDRMDISCEPLIDEVMEILNRRGIRKVVRVIPDPRKDIGFGIMSLFHYGQHVKVITCARLSEAEPHLA